MTKRFLTVTYEVEPEEGKKILEEREWVVAGWSNVFEERDEARRQLNATITFPKEPL